MPFSRASFFLLIGESSFKSRKQTEFRETEESVDQPSEEMECFVFRLKNQYLDLNRIVCCYPLKVSSIEDWLCLKLTSAIRNFNQKILCLTDNMPVFKAT